MEPPLATPSQIMPTGTCILVEGVLQRPLSPGKHSVELKAEKIIHMGLVEQPNKYPLSKKRVPLDALRDFPHFRPRTTTVRNSWCHSIVASKFSFTVKCMLLNGKLFNQANRSFFVFVQTPLFKSQLAHYYTISFYYKRRTIFTFLNFEIYYND